MPTLPPGLREWLPSGFFTALLGLIWYEVKASEARLNKRIDGVKEEIRAVNHRLDAMNDKIDARLDAMNDRLDAMNDKMDRLLETLLASKS